MRGRSSHIHDVEYRGKAKARGTFVCVKRRLHSSTFTQPGAETARAGGARSSASTPLSGTMLRRGSPRAGHTPLCCDQLLHGAGWSCMDSPHAQLCGRRHRHIRCSSCIVEGHDGPLFAASLPRRLNSSRRLAQVSTISTWLQQKQRGSLSAIARPTVAML